MADQYLFDNEDSEDERADAEEKDTLAARDTWVGIANSTQDQFKVETFLERVREKSVGGGASGGIPGLSECFGFQGSNDKSKFELGERMSNEAVNINGEEYKKVRIPTDNTLKSKLVLIKLFKVDDGETSEPIFIDRIKIKCGLIIIYNPSTKPGHPDYLVVAAKGQWRESSRWIPHKGWKSKDRKSTYDPDYN